MVSPVIPGTARASARPSTARSTPGPRHREHEHPGGPGGAGGRRGRGRPRALASTISSRLAPPGKRSAREHRPPMDRAASSSMAGPRSRDAQFGVDRAGRQPERSGPRPRRCGPPRRACPGQPGGGDQQGFLERGAVGGGGLVEDGGDGQVAGGQQAVDAQLRAGQVLLDEQGLVGGPFGFIQDLPDPAGGLDRGGRVVGAQHALAGAERHRLDHAREPDRLGRLPDAVLAAGTIRKAGWGTPAAAQRCRWAALSVAASTASTGLCGRPIRAATVAASTSIGVSAATTASTRPGPGQDPAGAGVGVGGADRDDGAAAERQRAVAADDEVQAHPFGRQEEVGRPVGARGHQQQHARPGAVTVSPGRRTARCPPRGR